MKIVNRYTQLTLWESDHATVRETLEAAVKAKTYLGGAYLGNANLGNANLVGANLVGAYLVGANLGGASLVNAYLGNANLGGAYLGNANLGGANLGNAYLVGAYLVGANLVGANLVGAYLGGAYLGDLATGPFCKWRVYGKGDSITIGCKTKTITEWDSFFASDEQYETGRKSPAFLYIHANYLAQRAWQIALTEGAAAMTKEK